MTPVLSRKVERCACEVEESAPLKLLLVEWAAFSVCFGAYPLLLWPLSLLAGRAACRGPKNGEISAKSILTTTKGLAARKSVKWEVGERGAVGRLAARGPAGSRSRGRGAPGCALAESDCASIVRKRGLRCGERAPSTAVRASLLPGGRRALLRSSLAWVWS